MSKKIKVEDIKPNIIYWHCRKPFITASGNFRYPKYARTPYEVRFVEHDVRYEVKKYDSYFLNKNNLHLEYLHPTKKEWIEPSWTEKYYISSRDIYLTKEDALEEYNSILYNEMDRIESSYQKVRSTLENDIKRIKIL